MSFLRPDAVQTVLRWSEPVLSAILALWLARITWGLLASGNPLGVLALIGAGIATLWTVVSGIRRILGRRALGPGGPGVVTLQEGRIGYFGPSGGGFVAVDALIAVDLVALRRGGSDGLVWQFSDAEGGYLAIPQTAEGAEDLLDTLGVLPRLDYARIV
ncbi:MAG: hypothetical protein AAF501_05715, partial [Pseudomonadota bacterium]